MNIRHCFCRRLLLLSIICGATALAACSASTAGPFSATDQQAPAGILTLPQLDPAPLNGERLKVVATTTIIGDAVAQVGRESIDLTVLIDTEQDPHNYEPVAGALATASEAHVIFVNGWDLEEALIPALEAVVGGTPIVPVAANIQPLILGDQTQQAANEHSRTAADPHTWFSIQNVEQWVRNIERVLSTLDPANAGKYESNATAHLAQLKELASYAETELAAIPIEKRFLVTNHDSFGYFARDYDFEVLGAVIPSISALAEPSAADLVGLIEKMGEHRICTIFAETTANDALAQTVAAELDGCDQVQVLPLYTGALGPEGSSADSYIGMFRTNVDTIVRGLK